MLRVADVNGDGQLDYEGQSAKRLSLSVEDTARHTELKCCSVSGAELSRRRLDAKPTWQIPSLGLPQTRTRRHTHEVAHNERSSNCIPQRGILLVPHFVSSCRIRQHACQLTRQLLFLLFQQQ